MDDPTELRWREFEALGEEEVRKRVANRAWSEQKEELARQWILLREGTEASESRRETLAVAREANKLALEANRLARRANAIASEAADSASRTAKAARKSNIIAILALIAAATAIALSVMNISWHH